MRSLFTAFARGWAAMTLAPHHPERARQQAIRERQLWIGLVIFGGAGIGFLTLRGLGWV
jgi:hypothetical protein